MSAAGPRNYAKPIRILRRALGIVLLGNLLVGILDAARGMAVAFLPFACVLSLGCVIAFQTYVLHRIDAQNKPRPDYSLIGAMEREVYGETFEHDGAPEKDPIAELKAQMDDLAERATNRLSGREKQLRKREEQMAPYRWAMGLPASRSSDTDICPRGHEYFRAGHDDRCYECEEERHNARYPDTTQPATLDQYVRWLEGYTKRGGKVTHPYDRPFGRAEFRYASTSLTIDSSYEYGARARHIIVASGVLTELTNPHEAFGGWGHSNLYFMHGYRQAGRSVPVYSDPEFSRFR